MNEITEPNKVFPSLCDYRKTTEKQLFDQLGTTIHSLDGAVNFEQNLNRLATGLDEIGANKKDNIIDGLISAHTRLVTMDRTIRSTRRKLVELKRSGRRKSEVIQGRDQMIKRLQKTIKDLKKKNK